MSNLTDAFLERSQDIASLTEINAWLTGKEPLFKAVVKGLLRSSFLIESVANESVSTTKIRTRWSLANDDPRKASFDQCVAIFEKLARTLQQTEDNLDFLQNIKDYSVLPYELPINFTRLLTGSIHTEGNVSWDLSDEIRRTITLRKFLLDSETNQDHQAFSAILKDKIKVKVYLTDRVLTGEYKTNREKRWEVHPKSVHFSERSECFMIEHKLIQQLCHFKNFPVPLKEKLIELDLLENSAVCTCPITYEELDFTDFKRSVLEPEWGRSKFQVGHLHPLKAQEADQASGHSADNIAWVTADGNRLQGHLTIDEWRSLLDKIIKNKTQHNGR